MHAYVLSLSIFLQEDERRQPFIKKIGDLFSSLLKSAPIDAAVDQMSTEFIHTSLPPVLEEGNLSGGEKSIPM